MFFECLCAHISNIGIFLNVFEFHSNGSMSGKVKEKDTLKKEIIEALIKMLDDVNPYVQKFRSARERFDTNPEDAFHMRIISDRLKDGRTYNTPTASEVAALIP